MVLERHEVVFLRWPLISVLDDDPSQVEPAAEIPEVFCLLESPVWVL